MYNKDIAKVKNKIKGASGEILAVNLLKQKKYRIIKTNYTNKIGEIDIIAEKDGVVVFVEVKTRSTLAYGRPIEAVDWRKQNKLKKTAELYLMFNHKFESDVRFDVIEIVGEQINHIENAFM